MRLKEFLGKVSSVEVSERELGTTKSFDSKFHRLVEEIKTTICKEYGVPIEEFGEISEEIEFISPKIKKLYEEFNQLLKESIENLRKLVAY